MAILIIFLGFFALPFFADASVVINEISWMGTSNSAQDEWIELYSDSGANLEGWILKTVDDAMSIPLSGSIPAGGYFVCPRNRGWFRRRGIEGLLDPPLFLRSSGLLLIIIRNDDHFHLQLGGLAG